MYLEEVILDGFKSYSTRTIVSGFDPKFNAITGLNGSGKSNLLDAICFVLGISNLSQVRVSNLQELVYKQGQAGITKASVSLIFNNENPRQGPIGYEQYKKITVTRTIVIGGRNKYLINGRTAQLNQVQTLFHSVQLNVNNPHFLIMQGRITKVLNMKPIEILGMIEEAAGTKMYEINRQKAVAIIEKKEIRVQEINRMLKEDITPTLEKLQSQKNEYLKWISNQSEHDNLKKLCVVLEYERYSQMKTKLEEKINSQKQHEVDINNRDNELKNQLIEINNSINMISVRMQSSSTESELHILTKKESGCSKELVVLKSKIDNVGKNISEYNAQLDSFGKNKLSMKNQSTEIEVKTQKLSREFEEVEGLKSHWENILSRVQLSGMDHKQILQQTLNETKNRYNNLSLERQNIQTMISTTNDQLSTNTIELNKLEVNQNLLNDQENKLKLEYDNIMDTHNKIKLELSNMNKIENDCNSLNNQLQTINMDLSQLTNQIKGYNFIYNKPRPDFDHSLVYGAVFRLFRVKRKEMNLALETIAGGRLYQIVVEKPDIGRLLITSGGLKQRFTFIPLEGIDHHVTEQYKIDKSKEMFPNQVFHALEEIEFDEIYRPAMQFVFGRSFICTSHDAAKSITFHKDIKERCVTMDGDCYEPFGTIQGGSVDRNMTILDKMTEINSKENEKYQLIQSVDTIKNKLNGIRDVKNNYKLITEKLQVKEHEMNLCKQRNMNNTYNQLLSTTKDLEAKLNDLTNKYSSLNDQFESCSEEIRKYELQLSYTSSNQDQLQEYKDPKSKLTDIEKKYRKIQDQFELIKLEKEDLSKEIARNDEEMIKLDCIIDENKQSCSDLENEYSVKNKEYDDIKNRLQELQQLLSISNNEINELLSKKERIDQEITKNEMHIKQTAYQITKLTNDLNDVDTNLNKFISENQWIVADNESNILSKENTKNKSLEIIKQRMHDLEKEQDRIERKINKKVLGMIDKATSDYNDLKKKKEKLEVDKVTIQSTIRTLDEKKITALEKTYDTVNTKFAEIFSTLLPSAQSKLVKVDQNNITKGLEVKVGFGGVFKESLSELSGGQRSLIALSLVLAMLLHNPAPMYILDEVDAALDLSHTQNIGLMLHKHFQSSQFIVVSLKEGMFNNANVVFRTKFVDGISTVTRTANR